MIVLGYALVDRTNKTRMGLFEPPAQDVPAPPVQPPLASQPVAADAAGQPSSTLSPEPYIGQVFAGRYRVVQKLGEGGMGAVYLAQHVTLEKQVALKILHAECARKPELVERFLQEAKTASRIRHQNIIDITDFGSTADNTVFFAMGVLKDQDLHEVLTRTKLEGHRMPWQRSRHIFFQVCGALAAAHAAGVIHRDLKPENIYLVDWYGQPDFIKLLDFGIAKLSTLGEGERKLTRTGMLFGTPEYMSPEQARGDKVDHRIDIYAMGCILYQLITGSVPFRAGTFMGVLTQHLTHPVPVVPVEELAGVGAPLGSNAVIQKALAKSRDERFASVEEMVAALEAVERGDMAPFAAPMPAAGAAPAPTPATALASALAPAGSAAPNSAADAQAARARTQWTGRPTLPEVTAARGRSRRSRHALLWTVVLGLVLGAAVVGGLVLVGPPGVVESGGQVSGAATGAGSAAASDTAGGPVVLRLVSVPAGAQVVDDSGAVLGVTPLDHRMQPERARRGFRFRLPGYQDKLIELVPMRSAAYAVELRPASDAGVVALGRGDAGAGEAGAMPQTGSSPGDHDDTPAGQSPAGARAGSPGEPRQGSGGPDSHDIDIDPLGEPELKNPFAE